MDFPAAYHNQSRILSLPIFPEMTEEMIEHVANQIRRAFGDGAAVKSNVAGFAKV
jgi:dTDP-4-amino-4,6-dideoxygalactose transaminase